MTLAGLRVVESEAVPWSELRMIIIDVEIKKAILGRNETPIEGIEYCGGWRDFEGMGISCVCTYDITTHLTRVFLEEDQGAFSAYVYGKPTAGFNTKRFDMPLLAANGWWTQADGVLHYDMLEQIWLALGLNADKFNPRTHGGWGLDAVCQATLGIRKTGHGALAPVWWQHGRRGRVIDYCCNDVWMEGQLLLHILREGWVTRDAGEVLPVERPRLSNTLRTPEDMTEIIGRQYRAAQAKAFEEVPAPPLMQVDYGNAPLRDVRGVATPDDAPQTSPSGLGIVR